VITIGGVHKFRFNHPAEAAVLRERRRVGTPEHKYDDDGDDDSDGGGDDDT
jgi:hypothetical protein